MELEMKKKKKIFSSQFCFQNASDSELIGRSFGHHLKHADANMCSVQRSCRKIEEKTKDFWEPISYKISCASPKGLSKRRPPGSVSLWGGVEVMMWDGRSRPGVSLPLLYCLRSRMKIGSGSVLLDPNVTGLSVQGPELLLTVWGRHLCCGKSYLSKLKSILLRVSEVIRPLPVQTSSTVPWKLRFGPWWIPKDLNKTSVLRIQNGESCINLISIDIFMVMQLQWHA